MINLTSKRRAFLRKRAHDIEPLVRVGKDGITDNLINSIMDAINNRELIKVKILQNCEDEKDVIFENLSNRPEFQVVGMIGKTIILFRENEEKPTISLEVKNI